MDVASCCCPVSRPRLGLGTLHWAKSLTEPALGDLQVQHGRRVSLGIVLASTVVIGSLLARTVRRGLPGFSEPGALRQWIISGYPDPAWPRKRSATAAQPLVQREKRLVGMPELGRATVCSGKEHVSSYLGVGISSFFTRREGELDTDLAGLDLPHQTEKNEKKIEEKKIKRNKRRTGRI